MMMRETHKKEGSSVGTLITVLVLVSILSSCNAESSETLWLVDTEADWYEGHMVYVGCNDTDALHFTGEKILFEDGFTWSAESDAPWNIKKLDKDKDDNLRESLNKRFRVFT